MELSKALDGMFDAENKLRTPEGVANPVILSENMVRLSLFTGAVEESLAQLERDFEVENSTRLRYWMTTKALKVTQAEREVDIELGKKKGEIKYLTRIVASAWRQVGVVQSRVNHLIREAGTQI